VPGRLKQSSRDLALEIVRRATGDSQELNGYVVHLSDPPTSTEKMRLAAFWLLGRSFAIMPASCATVDEWIEQYGAGENGPS
jgi:hypothetical protein